MLSSALPGLAAAFGNGLFQTVVRHSPELTTSAMPRDLYRYLRQPQAVLAPALRTWRRYEPLLHFPRRAKRQLL